MNPWAIVLCSTWNDPVNEKHFSSVIRQFINPGFRIPELVDSAGFGLSHYAANSHVMSGNKSIELKADPAGLANTMVVGEVNAQFKPWGHPGNWRDLLRGINQSPHGFGGPPGAGGANFMMGDGSVRLVSDQVSPDVLRAMSNAPGKAVPWQVVPVDVNQ